MKVTLALGLAAALVLAQSHAALAAEIRVMSVLGMRAVLDELGPQFERATGHRVGIALFTSRDLLERVRNGETADVVIMPRQGVETLIKRGKVAPGSGVVVARSRLGVAVRKGAARPDVSTSETFKRALLSAKSITYANPAHGAASGIHFAKVLDLLGIADEIRPRTIFLPKAGPVGILVANGEAELAVHQLQELIPIAGIDIVGPLPDELQDTLFFVAAGMSGSVHHVPATELIEFLRTPESAKTIRAKGMEPG